MTPREVKTDNEKPPDCRAGRALESQRATRVNQTGSNVVLVSGAVITTAAATAAFLCLP